MTTATPIKIQDVTGKDLYYILLENTKAERHFVNVGEKTYNKLVKLEEDTTSLNQKLSEAEDTKKEQLKKHK